jgi:tetratricopeptide (TPR) repeat protein
MKRFEDALLCYQKAAEMEEDSLTWFNIGSIFYRQNEFKQAVIALEKAKRLNSSFALPVLVMGLSYRHLANIKAAEHCFKDVLSLTADNEVALTGLTMLFFDSGKLHQALEMADRLLIIKPGNISVRKLRSNILYGLGRTGESAGEIKELRENDKGYRSFDDFVESIPSDIFDDRFGGIESKIDSLEEKVKKTESQEDMMALSLCYLFKGDSDRAIDFLFKAKDAGI